MRTDVSARASTERPQYVSSVLQGVCLAHRLRRGDNDGSKVANDGSKEKVGGGKEVASGNKEATG